MSKGLYIHIPFCKYICSYCDFGKKYIKNQPVDEYIDSVCLELDMYKPFTDVNSIYIGGGTPSSLNQNQLTKLLSKIAEVTTGNSIEEFSFEMNPDDVNEQILKTLKQFGVNRISLGAQTLNDSILEKLNRKHTASEVREAVKLATDIIDNVSVDFMFNLPGQTKADIDQTLEFIDQSNIQHVSYYGLIFEDHTILATEDHKYWSVDYESEMYSYIQNCLNDYGFEQYEISNYAKNGKQSIHNIHYWIRNEYYGIGLSSSGFIGNKRYTNTYSLKSYIDQIANEKFPVKDEEIITTEDEQFEKIMLGLRYHSFVELDPKVIEAISNDSFLADKFDYKRDAIRLKPSEYYISNQIILDVIERIEC
ncbi:radical SAM family heme chaperone HemW [Mollicutes bacterium LVI A0078]|nr:radical SAM family heme chaperone HemW [Mollicutes bacterium LVI A0075]WOO90782.1 radical SAM family heme chaperone HemW [Mollicutes bacterium LVI A0078]